MRDGWMRLGLRWAPHRTVRGWLDQHEAPTGEDARGPAGAPKWVEAHLAECERCTQWWQRRGRLAAAYQVLRTVSAPEGFAARVEARARGEANPARPGSAHPSTLARSLGWRREWVWAAVAAVVVLAWVQQRPWRSGDRAVSDRGGDPVVERLGPVGPGVVASPAWVLRAVGDDAAASRRAFRTACDRLGVRPRLGPNGWAADVPAAKLPAFLRDLAATGRVRVPADLDERSGGPDSGAVRVRLVW